MITADRLKEIVSYDQSTGIFTRLNPLCGARIKSGTITSEGYLSIFLDGKNRKAHRMAWLYVFGEIPSTGLDHINGDKTDNRIANLRLANHAENNQNIRRPYRNNKISGVLGVYWHEKGKKWQARIQLNKKAKSLGFFDSKEAAGAAYLQAKQSMHPFGTL